MVTEAEVRKKAEQLGCELTCEGSDDDGDLWWRCYRARDGREIHMPNLVSINSWLDVLFPVHE